MKMTSKNKQKFNLRLEIVAERMPLYFDDSTIRPNKGKYGLTRFYAVNFHSS